MRPARPAVGPPSTLRAQTAVSSIDGQACLDCGTPLHGRFCSVCGQKDEPLKRGLKDLLFEFVQHPLIDTKLWRSLVPLLFRPGALTEQYLAGRRTRYLRPLKLYLTVSVVFFALFALKPPRGLVHLDLRDTSPGASAEADKPEPKKSAFDRWMDKHILEKAKGLDAEGRTALAQSLSVKVSALFPKMVFVLLPLTAVLFKLFWWKRYFVEHLVFTLHLHSFFFAAGMLVLTRWVPVAVVFAIWCSVYVVSAFKRVYRDGWPKTLGKLAGVSFLYMLLFAIAVSATALTVLAGD